MMEEQEQLEVGNSTIEAGSEFVDGYYNGKLYYYDTNSQLSEPLTSEAIGAFIAECLFDKSRTPEWNTGFVLGWIAALCENDPEHVFTSTVLF